MLGEEFIIAAGESMNDRRLSPDEVARFHGDGYLLKPALFDAEEVALMRRALASDAGIGDQRNTMAMHDADGSVTTTVLWTDPGDDLFGAIARCERVVDAAERLLGGEVYHYHSKLTLKAPETGGAWNWHQDYGYWYFNGNLFPDMLSVFIAIDPATQASGWPPGHPGLGPHGPPRSRAGGGPAHGRAGAGGARDRAAGGGLL